MLMLPAHPRRVLLRSFWLVMSLAAGLLTVTIAGLFGSSLFAALVAFVALFVGLFGWLRPQAAALPYRLWNRVAFTFARAARLWLTGICFLIVTAVGCAGSRLPWRRPRSSGSGWRRRATLVTSAYTSQSDREDSSAERDWIVSLLAWSRDSRNIWVWALVPFLFFLSIMQIRPSGSLGGNTYTLY